MISYKRIEHPRYKYELTDDATFDVPVNLSTYFDLAYFAIDNGVLTVKKSYAWDGLTSWPDTRRNLAASLAHDALLQCEDLMLIKRRTSDIHRVFRGLIENRFEAWVLYAGLRIFYPIRQLVKRL